jgi:large subunit ribosomal protein L22
MSVSASAKGVRMSPRKVAVVASLVRGRSVNDAITILSHTPRRAALPVKKTIESARANAEHNHNFKPDTLTIVPEPYSRTRFHPNPWCATANQACDKNFLDSR